MCMHTLDMQDYIDNTMLQSSIERIVVNHLRWIWFCYNGLLWYIIAGNIWVALISFINDYCELDNENTELQLYYQLVGADICMMFAKSIFV